MSRML